jgi:hypothetical protein
MMRRLLVPGLDNLPLEHVMLVVLGAGNACFQKSAQVQRRIV